MLGNSVTEEGFVPTASCMTCHARAAVNGQGLNAFPFFGNKKTLPLEQIPQIGSSTETLVTYNGSPDPNWFYTFTNRGGELVNLQTDFVWAIPFKAHPANPKRKSEQ
ncbi:hypothetical protein IH824_17020 [candidate division KSB1 bacterium]|nr:hypothetical protein [candidate division KSB1 bacterium]